MKINEILDKLLEINLEMKSVLESAETNPNFNIEFEKLLENRISLIENIENIKKSSKQDISISKNSHLKEICEKIQGLEKENLSIIKDKQNNISQEINNIKNSSKVLSSYKFNQELPPRLVDDEL